MQLRLSTSPILDSYFIPDAIEMMPGLLLPVIPTGRPRKALAIDLDLVGRCPSKKNKLTKAYGGGQNLRYKKGVKDAITSLLTQARAQYGPRLRLSNHPSVEVWMQVEDAAQDQDGILTTIIDVLKKAAVIEDDSIKFFNGVKIVYPATIGEPWVKIRLSWRDGDAEHYDH